MLQEGETKIVESDKFVCEPYVRHIGTMEISNTIYKHVRCQILRCYNSSTLQLHWTLCEILGIQDMRYWNKDKNVENRGLLTLVRFIFIAWRV